MRKTLRKKLFKSVLWFSLFVFLPFAFGIDVYAQDRELKEEVQNQKLTVILNSLKDKDFDEVLTESEEILEKDFSDDLRKDAFRTILNELKERDKEIRKRFTLTEKILKERNLPPEILNRHKEFVEKYEGRFKEFDGKVNSYLKSNWLTGRSSRNGLKGFIEKNTYKKKIPEFDPNKLPHRSMPVKKIQTEEYKPAEQKELKKIEKQGKSRGDDQGSRFNVLRDTFNVARNNDSRYTNLVTRPSVVGGTSLSRESRLGNRSYKAGDKPQGLLLPSDSGGERMAESGMRSSLSNELFAYSGDVAMLPLLVSQGGDGYLQETMEVQFTEEIQELAEELEYKPVEIYEYLRNSFKYEPYYGSLKGAQETLSEKAGNDFDLASLLISLLRTSGIKSRYVYGEIIVPIDGVMSWLGVKDPWVAGSILATNGIPSVMLTVGGKPHSIRMKHCWVEAYIPWMGGKVYRGAYDPEDTGNAKWMWVPMDVSFKEQWFFERIDVSDVPFNESEYLDTLRNSVFDFYFNSIQNYIEENYPDSSIAYGFYGSPIKSLYIGYIPGTLPYKAMESPKDRYAEIPDNFRHKVRFEILDEYKMTDISHTISFPELAEKSVSLFYTPATSSDEATIESYGGLYKTPAYLIKLKPQLRINNEIKATGEAIGFGKTQTVTMSFVFPGIGEIDRIENEFTSGAWYDVVFDYQNVGEESRVKHLDNLVSLLDSLDFSDTTETLVPEPFWAEEFLYGFGLSYFSMLDVASSLLKRCLRIVSTREPSEVITGFDASVVTLLGIPYRVELSGLFVDADRLSENTFSIYNDKSKEVKYTVVRGYESSFLEHYVIELWLNSPAISAVKALQLASLEGMEIYDIDKSNINTILPELNISNEVKQEIKDGVNAGSHAKVSQSSINIGDWMGVGYIIRDPVTGSACYKISGGYNGSVETQAGVQTWKYKHIGQGLINHARVWAGGANKGNLPHATDEQKNRYCMEQEDLFNIEALSAYYCLIRAYKNTFIKYQEESLDNFIYDIADTRLMVFVFCGHGEVTDGRGTGLKINRSDGGVISYSSITDVEPLTFVFLSACCGADGLGSFPLSGKGASVGYSKKVSADHSMEYSWHLLTRLSTSMPLGDAKKEIEEYYPKLNDKLDPVYTGNMGMILGNDEERKK